VAEGLNRTVSIVLNAVTDSYNRSIAEAQKTTDAAVSSIQASAANASKSFDALSVSVKTSGLANVETTQSMAALNTALNASNAQFAQTATVAASAAESTKKVAESAAATATAETNAATATAKVTDAFKASTSAATEAAAKTMQVGQAAQTVGTAIENTGKQSNTAGSFLSSLGGAASKLVPSLGSVATIAAGAATGMTALQIAEKVGGWLLDTGLKALSSSEALKGLNATLGSVKTAFSEAAGKGVEALAQAFTTLFGPAIQKVSGWVTEALKWVSAFGDWFIKSGVIQNLAQKLFDTLSTGFSQIRQFVSGAFEGIGKALGLVNTSLDSNAKASDFWAQAWRTSLDNVIHYVAYAAAVIQAIFEKLAEQANKYNESMLQNTQRELAAIGGLWNKLALKMPEWIKFAFDVIGEDLGTLRDGLKKDFQELGHSINTDVNSPLKGIGDRISDLTKRNESAIQGVVTWVVNQKNLIDHLHKTGDALQGVGTAVETVAEAHRKFSMDSIRAWEAQLALAKKLNEQISGMTPVYKEVDQATEAMAREAIAGAEKVIRATESIKFATDKQIDDMIYNVREGWKQQVSLAGTSTEEIKRINQAAWATITQTISKDWFNLSKDQQQALAELGAEVRKSADEHGQILTKDTEQTGKELGKQESMWKDAQRNITKLVRQTASDITDALWSGDKSFGEITKSLLTDIGKMFTQIFVQQGVAAVGKFIQSLLGGNGLTAALGEVTKAFKGVGDLFGGLGGGAGTAAKAGGDAAGGAGGALGGALGGISGAMNMVTGAISAVTGIIGIFQTKGTQKIEENIQQGVFLTYMAVHDLYTEFQAYTRNQVVGLRADITHWGSELWNQLSAGFNNMRTGFATITAQLAALAGAFNVQSLADAISRIQLAPATGVPVDVSSFSVDFTPVVSVLNEIRNALSQSALRPNVNLSVETGVTSDQVAKEIVRQLQLAGVVR
jgi:hypothetical protein